MDNINIKLISSKDILEYKCLDISETISIMERSFIDFYNKEVMLPDKISMVFDEEKQSRINCMPSTLKKDNVCGVKWVSVFPENPVKFNVSNISGVIILSELEKGYPLAFVEGSLITATRTACMGAIASKYLAKKKCYTYCSIGAGEQAQMHFRAIKVIHPEISICNVASRTKQSVDKFIKKLQLVFPEVQFINCENNYDKASINTDIIVTAVSCQAPLLKAKTIKKGAFYCHVGGWEDEYAVPLKANKIICDCWESVKHRTQTISRLYKERKLKDKDIYADIGEVISGLKKGRENDDEFIYFNSVGLGFVDVAIAKSIYEKSVARGFGSNWLMKE